MKPLTTRQEILNYAAEVNSAFFRKDVMKHYKTVLYDELVFPVPKLQATIFISSDLWDELKNSNWVKARSYSVRKIKWEDGDVETISQPGEFKNKLRATIWVTRYLLRRLEETECSLSLQQI